MKKFNLSSANPDQVDESVIIRSLALGTYPHQNTVKEGIITRLDAAFPTKELLNLSDVSRFTGKSRYWCRKHFPLQKGGDVMSKSALAELLC